MFDHLPRCKFCLLHNAVAPGVNLPGWDVCILVEGEEGVVEEEVDEAFCGEADCAGHIEDPQIWATDTNVCKQLHTDRLAVPGHRFYFDGKDFVVLGEISPVLNRKTSCGQFYTQLDLSEFLKAIQPKAEDVAEGEEQVLAVWICCVRSAWQRRRG